ncbi:hypothetical protein Peur_050260 [Populus x canadensis]
MRWHARSHGWGRRGLFVGPIYVGPDVHFPYLGGSYRQLHSFRDEEKERKASFDPSISALSTFFSYASVPQAPTLVIQEKLLVLALLVLHWVDHFKFPNSMNHCSCRCAACLLLFRE